MSNPEVSSENITQPNDQLIQAVGHEIAKLFENTSHPAIVSPETIERIKDSYGNFIEPYNLAVYKRHADTEVPLAAGLRTPFDLFGDDLSTTPKVALFGDSDMMHKVMGQARYDPQLEKAVITTRSSSAYLVSDIQYIGLMSETEYNYYLSEKLDRPQQSTLFFNTKLSIIINRTSKTDQRIATYIQRHFYGLSLTASTESQIIPTEKHETQSDK